MIISEEKFVFSSLFFYLCPQIGNLVADVTTTKGNPVRVRNCSCSCNPLYESLLV